MKHLINREDYIREYLRISDSIENENELYEGLLSTLFGGLKMLLKKDWANIKCKNPSVLKHLQEIDKSLGGYTMTKMEFSGECTTIRQNIADYFNDILEYKLAQIEKEDDPDKFLEKENKEKEDENNEENDVAKKLNLKDKTLLDSLDKYKSNINTACKPSPKLREYADMMLNSVEVFVNDIILAELEKKGLDKAKAEEERKKIEEEEKKLEAIRGKMDKAAKDADGKKMKKLAKERDKAMTTLGAKPIGPMDGDKAFDTIAKDFKKVLSGFEDMKLNESANQLPGGYGNILGKDTYLGIKKSLEAIGWNVSDKKKIDKLEAEDKFIIRVILSKINTVFNVIANDKLKPLLKGVPSASVQAMMVALSNAIIYGFVNSDDKKIDINDDVLKLLTKCAIDSDATIGFNLPLLDANKPENGNLFVSIMNQFRESEVNSDEIKNIVDATSEKERILVLKAFNKYKKDNSDKENLKLFIDWAKVKMDNFKKNMADLFKKIQDKATKIKEKAKKDREAEAAKAKLNSKAK
jgi:hypothetical protein